MEKQIEEGWYMFRIKFTNRSDELEVTYNKFKLLNKDCITRVRQEIIDFYSDYAKGALEITHKYHARTNDGPYYFE